METLGKTNFIFLEKILLADLVLKLGTKTHLVTENNFCNTKFRLFEY